VLQAGAFRNLASADALKASLERLTGSRAYVVRVSNEALYRVRLGPVESEAEALRLRSLIMDANLDEPMIIRE
jgi:rare lipoprotein A